MVLVTAGWISGNVIRAIEVTVLERSNRLGRPHTKSPSNGTHVVACPVTREVDVNVARTVVGEGVIVTVVEAGDSKHEQAPEIDATGWRVKLLKMAAWEFAWRPKITSRFWPPP